MCIEWHPVPLTCHLRLPFSSNRFSLGGGDYNEPPAILASVSLQCDKSVWFDKAKTMNWSISGADNRTELCHRCLLIKCVSVFFIFFFNLTQTQWLYLLTGQAFSLWILSRPDSTYEEEGEANSKMQKGDILLLNCSLFTTLKLLLFCLFLMYSFSNK